MNQNILTIRIKELEKIRKKHFKSLTKIGKKIRQANRDYDELIKTIHSVEDKIDKLKMKIK